MIDSENRIDAVEGRRPKGLTRFRTEQELRKATTEWPITRLVEVWNQLPGATPVKTPPMLRRGRKAWWRVTSSDSGAQPSPLGRGDVAQQS